MMFPHNFIGSFLKTAGSFKHLHSQDLSGLFFQLPITTGCVDDSWKRKSKRCDALASYFKYAFGKSASQPVQFCHLYRKLNDINQMNSTRKSCIKFPLGLAKVFSLVILTFSPSGCVKLTRRFCSKHNRAKRLGRYLFYASAI